MMFYETEYMLQTVYYFILFHDSDSDDENDDGDNDDDDDDGWMMINLWQHLDAN